MAEPAPAASAPPTRLYLSPGLFGFARLAGFDYLQHVQAGLAEAFARRGRTTEVRVVDAHPCASIRRRATQLAELVAATAGDDDGPIHLLGHSTGGLDLRLLVSPTTRLAGERVMPLGWLPRLASVTSMNTPHYGTPLAKFFATPNGQRFLFAITAITLTSLWLGRPPLAATSLLVAALSRTRELVRLQLGLVDRIIETLMSALGVESRLEVRDWMRRIQDDQGAIVQLSPEAMDLFQATVEDRPGVRYQCTASFAPPSGPRDWMGHLRAPWPAVSAGLFHLIWRTTADVGPRYPCSPGPEADAALRGRLPSIPPPNANDGIVPLRSQLWGTPVWVGEGDHLDVVGYFGTRPGHGGWLTCGAKFGRERFDELMERIVEGMLEGEAALGAGGGRAGSVPGAPAARGR